MATPELAPGEEYDFDGVHIEPKWDNNECHIITITDGWKRREVDIEVDERGGHIDGMDYESQTPFEEKAVVFGAVAKLVRLIRPEIITVEDPEGNLL